MLRNTDIAVMLRNVPKRSARDAYVRTYENVQQTLGLPPALGGLKDFINLLNSGGATSGTIVDLNILKVAPHVKGTKGKIRSVIVGTTIKRLAFIVYPQVRKSAC